MEIRVTTLGVNSNTLCLFHIAMEHSPFTDDFPIKTSIYNGFSINMLYNKMVNL